MEFTLAQLEDLIQDVAERTARAIVVEMTAREDRLLDRIEAADVLGISVATLDRRRRDGLIPSLMIGRRRLYRLPAILASVEVIQADDTDDCRCGSEAT